MDLPIKNGDFPCFPNWLVVQQPSWKMMDFVNGKDDISYLKEHKNVWNHQPDWNMSMN